MYLGFDTTMPQFRNNLVNAVRVETEDPSIYSQSRGTCPERIKRDLNVGRLIQDPDHPALGMVTGRPPQQLLVEFPAGIDVENREDGHELWGRHNVFTLAGKLDTQHLNGKVRSHG